MLQPLGTVVFVLNSADFGPPSEWRCNSTHPTQEPFSAIYFVVRKYAFLDCVDSPSPEIRTNDFELRTGLQDLTRLFQDTEFKVLLYQSKSEWIQNSPLVPVFGHHFAEMAWSTYDLLSFPDFWSVRAYRDGIHPNAEGSADLARIIVAILGQN